VTVRASERILPLLCSALGPALGPALLLGPLCLLFQAFSPPASRLSTAFSPYRCALCAVRCFPLPSAVNKANLARVFKKFCQLGGVLDGELLSLGAFD